MTSNASPALRYGANIISIESGRLLGRGHVRLVPDTDDWCVNLVFGLDREDVILQFDTGLQREVSLAPQDSGIRNQYEYLVRWNGEGHLVPSTVPPEA